MLVARRLLALLVALTATAALAAPAQATFPGRNGEILLTQEISSYGPHGGTLVAIDPRARVERKLWECESNPTRPVADCDVITTPAASPDGRTTALVYGSHVFRTTQPREWTLLLIGLSGTSSKPLALPLDLDFVTDQRGQTLRWKGDGTVLTAPLWTHQFQGQFENRSLTPDGVLGPALGPPDALEFDWSIDGRAAYITGGNLFVLAPDGSQRRLTVRGASNPSWSPHGRWIAFARRKKFARRTQIWVIDSRGGRARRLTTGGGERPAWSPDGRRIAFLRFRQGEGYLYALDPRGGPAHRLYDTAVAEIAYGSTSVITSPPEWQALPR